MLNRTFNPSSSSSDSEDGVDKSKKEKQPTDEISVKRTNVKEFKDKKRSHSTETSTSKDENEAEAKRAKKDVDRENACALTVNRSKGNSRGRGRGRGQGKALMKNKTTAALRSSVDPTSSKSSDQLTNKQLSQENKKTSRRTRARSSALADNEKETYIHNVVENDNKRSKQCDRVLTRRRKDAKCIAEDEHSTSDTTDSEDNDESSYAGPKTVSVVGRGRGRGRARGLGPRRGR